MSTTQYYFNQSVGNLNKPYATIAELIAELGGYTNPAQDTYVPAAKIDVTDPTLMTIAQYINALGADGYTYKYDDILNVLNQATEAGQVAQQAQLRQNEAAAAREMGNVQDTAMDTIRAQYAQGIQSGINKGQQAANQLSAILAATQTGAEQAQANAEARINAANQYYADLAQNGATALDKSNAAYETMMSNIRQLYNDDIQQKTAELEYNASLEESLANYLAGKYTADTNYAMGINQNAAGIYNNNQTSLASLLTSAMSGEAQDNYSNAYLEAARLQAEATIRAAEIAAAAAAASGGGGGGGGGGMYSDADLQYMAAANYVPPTTSTGTSTAATNAAIANNVARAAASVAAATAASKKNYSAGSGDGIANGQSNSGNHQRISGYVM